MNEKTRQFIKDISSIKEVVVFVIGLVMVFANLYIFTKLSPLKESINAVAAENIRQDRTIDTMNNMLIRIDDRVQKIYEMSFDNSRK